MVTLGRQATRTSVVGHCPSCGPGARPCVPLPPVPKTASPVPTLTSIHATEGRGPYGDSGYRGNCSGILIRDLLLYYQPKRVLDPMTGGGTCRDVCSELKIECHALDLKAGFDAQDSRAYGQLGTFDFIWLHPPYWRMVRYSNNPQCLSNAPTLAEFDRRLQLVVANCRSVLTERGILAILIGDGKDATGYWGLPFRALWVAARENLWLAAPEIVRFQHGATSSTREYTTSFIPRLHDICLVLKRREQVTRASNDMARGGDAAEANVSPTACLPREPAEND